MPSSSEDPSVALVALMSAPSQELSFVQGLWLSSFYHTLGLGEDPCVSILAAVIRAPS